MGLTTQRSLIIFNLYIKYVCRNYYRNHRIDLPVAKSGNGQWKRLADNLAGPINSRRIIHGLQKERNLLVRMRMPGQEIEQKSLRALFLIH